MCSGFPADDTDGSLIRLAVEFQLLAVLFALPVSLDGLRRGGTRPQALQIIQFSHQVLHQVVFSKSPLAEHLCVRTQMEKRKQIMSLKEGSINNDNE